MQIGIKKTLITTFKYRQLYSGRMGLPVNSLTKNVREIESPGKDKETETNPNLLQSTVKKLPF
jgi:hypothetical protein